MVFCAALTERLKINLHLYGKPLVKQFQKNAKNRAAGGTSEAVLKTIPQEYPSTPNK